MKMQRLLLCAGFALLLASMNLEFSTVFAQGTAFSFQGRFNDGGSPANGLFALKFTLFSVPVGAGTIAGPVTNSATGITNGLFSVVLDFGNNFPGADRFLEIAARTNGNGAFTILSPRQKITAVPYAITAANVTGTLPNSGLSGTYANAVTFNNPGDSFSGNGGGLTNLNASQLLSGTVPGAVLSGTYPNAVTFNNAANSFTGSGAGLTSLNASSLNSGTVNDGRLSGNVALLNTIQTFTADKFFGPGAQLLADVGSAVAPSLSFAGDPNTGIFRPGANSVAIAGNGVEYLRVNSAGDVGIGTTSPSRELEVQGTGDVEIGIKSTDVNGHLWTIQSSSVTTNSTRDGSFQIIDRTFNGSRLLIATNGNVGIGTTGPDARLHVAGGTDASLDGGGFVVIGPTNAANIVIDNNEIMARNNGAKSTLYFNNDGGNVSIGGTVDGAFSTISLNNPVYTDQSIKPVHDGIHGCGDSTHRWFDVWAVNPFVQTSDIRYKTNIQSLAYGLKTVLSLRPVSFEWKQSPRNRRNLGLIAQEVETIVPEAVVRDENSDHPVGMMYSALIPILIQAVQEQQATIESQRTALAAQQSQLQALQKKLSGVDLVGEEDAAIETLRAQNHSLEQRIEAIEKAFNRVQQ